MERRLGKGIVEIRPYGSFRKKKWIKRKKKRHDDFVEGCVAEPVTAAQLKEEKDLDTLLDTFGLVRVRVVPDGACLFRAVAHWVGWCEAEHYNMRWQCCEYLESHKEEFAPFIPGIPIDAYIEKMREPSMWGSQVEIKALSEAFHLNMRIYSAYHEPGEVGWMATWVMMDTQFIYESKDPRWIMLCFTHGNHFDAVLEKKKEVPYQVCQSILMDILKANEFLNIVDDAVQTKDSFASVEFHGFMRERDKQEKADRSAASDLAKKFTKEDFTATSARFQLEHDDLLLAAQIQLEDDIQAHKKAEASIVRRKPKKRHQQPMRPKIHQQPTEEYPSFPQSSPRPAPVASMWIRQGVPSAVKEKYVVDKVLEPARTPPQESPSSWEEDYHHLVQQDPEEEFLETLWKDKKERKESPLAENLLNDLLGTPCKDAKPTMDDSTLDGILSDCVKPEAVAAPVERRPQMTAPPVESVPMRPQMTERDAYLKVLAHYQITQKDVQADYAKWSHIIQRDMIMMMQGPVYPHPRQPPMPDRPSEQQRSMQQPPMQYAHQPRHGQPRYQPPPMHYVQPSLDMPPGLHTPWQPPPQPMYAPQYQQMGYPKDEVVRPQPPLEEPQEEMSSKTYAPGQLDRGGWGIHPTWANVATPPAAQGPVYPSVRQPQSPVYPSVRQQQHPVSQTRQHAPLTTIYPAKETFSPENEWITAKRKKVPKKKKELDPKSDEPIKVQRERQLFRDDVICILCHEQGHFQRVCPLAKCFCCGRKGHMNIVCDQKPRAKPKEKAFLVL